MVRAMVRVRSGGTEYSNLSDSVPIPAAMEKIKRTS